MNVEKQDNLPHRLETAKETPPDILLVLPPLYQTGREPDYNPKEPMGLMYLAASLRQEGKKVEIFDASIEARTLQATTERILQINPPIVGFSVFQRALPSFQIIVEELRTRSYKGHITCGGITPSLSYSYILDRVGDKVDSVVLGEGEKVIQELLERILTEQDWRTVDGIAFQHNQNNRVVNRPIEVVDLDALPFATRDYLGTCLEKTNYATIMGSRGCYGICTFCSNHAFESLRPGPQWRPRSPALVVDEMQELYERYGVTVFKFNDPNLFGSGKDGRKHVAELAQQLQQRGLRFHLMAFCRSNDITTDPDLVFKMKAVGFERLLIGIESSNDQILRKFKKGETITGMEKALDILEDADISVVVGFMIFNPYTTLETLKADLAFLRKRKLMPTLSKPLRVFDNTPIQHILEAEGRLVKANPFEGYHEYVMDETVASIYASMKVLFAHCLDKIRAHSQGKIWDMKKAASFQERVRFNSLTEGFFAVESTLLDHLIQWVEEGFVYDTVRNVIDAQYTILESIGQYLGVDARSVMSDPRIVTQEIYNIMKNQPYSTFHEEYRWNQD